jgi:hypothetical protein
MSPCAAVRAAARPAAAALRTTQGGTYRGAKDAVRLGRGCMELNGLVAGRLGGRNEMAVRLGEVSKVEAVVMWHSSSA